MGLFDSGRKKLQGMRPGTRESIYLGRYYDDKTKQAGDEILYEDERHILVFGPTGCGKGAGFLSPNLLKGLEEQSVIVIDPKGELAAVTAEHRRQIGHEVIILNPFNVLDLGSEGFNPLANLDPNSPSFYDDAAGLGEALIKIGGQDPHWTESAQGLIVALLMWEKKLHGDGACLENVRAMLTEPTDFEEFIDDNGHLQKRPCSGLAFTAAKMVDRGGFVIDSLASRFTRENDEIASIQSSADTQTRWMLSPPMREDLGKDGVDFRKLKDHPTTVYVILPAQYMRTHSVWLRLVIVTALRSLYRPGGLRTVMLIDEMPTLGHLSTIEDAFGLVRGYRVQIAAIFQDLAQLKDIYKERWETFVANAGAIMAFAPNDMGTAEWMSKRTGQTTVLAMGFNENTGSSSGQKATTSSGSGLSEQQIPRAPYLPHELFGFEAGMGLLWLAGLSQSIKFFAPKYRKIRECRERAEPNPYYTGDA
jgi:type IV secretion system protein VirD4